MSIRPVDYQIMMPKVNEVARVQNDQQHKHVGHAQQQADSSVKQSEQNTKTVHSQEEAQKAIITEKEKEKEKKNKNRKRDQEKEGNENENKNKEKNLSPEGRTIDIRL